MRAAWGPVLALAALTAAADVAPGFERIPVINLQLNGGASFETVILPIPGIPELATHVCVREFDAPALRCYVLDTHDPRAPEWLTIDLQLAK